MKGLHKITFILLVVGGLNWGLEAFNMGVVRLLPEPLPMLVYLLVGISALIEIFTHKNNCMCCAPEGEKKPM